MPSRDQYPARAEVHFRKSSAGYVRCNYCYEYGKYPPLYADPNAGSVIRFTTEEAALRHLASHRLHRIGIVPDRVEVWIRNSGLPHEPKPDPDPDSLTLDDIIAGKVPDEAR